MKSKPILIALFCIGLSIPVCTFAQSGGKGGTIGGKTQSTYSMPISPFYVSVIDNECLDVYFMSANTSYEVTITNRSGHIVYRRNVNTQFTPQISVNIKGLPTDSYIITFKNAAANEVTTNNFEIK